MEILITSIIVIIAIYIIIKSIRNTAKGKCSGGCSKCSYNEKCSSNKENIK